MTTIIYDHENKLIACDSRECAGYEIKSDNVEKFTRRGDSLYFISGVHSDEKDFIDICEGGEIKENHTYNCSAIIVSNGKVFKKSYNEQDGLWEIELKYSDSIGSGGTYALCAKDFGKSAKECVEYAKTRDSGSGGKVHVFSVDENIFLTI